MMFYAQMIMIFVVTIVLSTLLGDMVLSKFDISKQWTRIGIGFFSFLAIYQILILPAQVFHFSTNYLMLALGIEVVGILMISFKRIKEIIVASYKEISLVVLFGIFGMILFYLCTETLDYDHSYGDVFYYLRLIQVNANPQALVNAIDPTSGINGLVSAQYAFSGFYHLFSGISMLLGTNSVLLTMWYGTLLFHGIAIAVITLIISVFKNKSIMFKLIVVFLCISAFFGYGVVYGFLPGYFRGRAGGAMLPIIFIVLYYKNNRKTGYLGLFLILSLALMACQSTQLFINVITIFGICAYEIFVKRNYNLHHYTIISIPAILYATAWMLYLQNYLMATFIVGVFVIVNLIYLNSFIKKYTKFVLWVGITLVFIAINASYSSISSSLWDFESSLTFFKEYYSFSLTSFNSITSLRTPIYFIALVLMAFRYKRLDEAAKFALFFSIIILLFFFNPFAAPFVSSYLTGEVYERVGEIYRNGALLLIVLSFLTKECKLLFYGYFTLQAIAILVAVQDEIVVTNSRIEAYGQHQSAMMRYKVSDNLLSLGEAIGGLEGEYKIIYPYKINNLMLMVNNVVQSDVMAPWSELRHMSIDWANIRNNSQVFRIQAAIGDPHYYYTDYLYQFDKDNMLSFKEMILATDTDLFIMSNWNSDESNTLFMAEVHEFAYLVYANDSYGIYQLYERGVK